MNRKKKVLLSLFGFVALLLWILWSEVLFVDRIKLNLLKNEAQKIRIALVTDLHSCRYGKNQRTLIQKIDNEKVDFVILAGDIFDDKIPDDNAKILIEDLVKKYPCYYVTGNHEFWSGRGNEMKDYLRAAGVNVLAGEAKTLILNNFAIDICGVDDPFFVNEAEWKNQLDSAFGATEKSHFKILVTHRPERIKIYEQYDFDLILAGHAHAGQVRIPFFNRGLFAPNQGFWAKYVNGPYQLSNGSVMEVSRGLARESTPLPRFFNHPQLVILDIE
ncbi:metallophosphoesterase [Treponema zioleckii]|uniref:metallophosphoesterase n=1 Tax=Treponema zioleckii TaxID=331680 RepID=UPI00168BC361|nr:metallophosphoesterase [Treponema zioleckii]